MARRCSGACFGELFSLFFGAECLVVDIWARVGDFGALRVGFGLLFGGFGWPLGAQWLDQVPLPGRGRVRVEGDSLHSGALKPYAESQKSMAKGQMP